MELTEMRLSSTRDMLLMAEKAEEDSCYITASETELSFSLRDYLADAGFDNVDTFMVNSSAQTLAYLSLLSEDTLGGYQIGSLRTEYIF
ncbi:MAG: hypothetical protein ACI4AB_09925 [Acetatifactor sp.]